MTPADPSGCPFAVLVVDDCPINRRVASGALQRLGYAASVAEDGLKALARLRDGGFHLVLMDLQMPEMDGLETTRQIRRAQALGEPGFAAKLPIIGFSANATLDARRECIAAGMDDYLLKPIVPQVLKALLEKHLLSAPAPVA